MQEFLKKRIPTIIGIILLLTGAITGVILVSKETGFLSRAAPEFAPQELTVTNISENSFTISWTTQQNTIGFINYGLDPSSLNETEQDDRSEVTNNPGEHQTHHITIRGLQPQAIYYFKVGSGGNNQFYDNSGQPYTVTTASDLGAPPAADTAYGEVVNNADAPVEGAIIYINLPNAARLSTTSKNAGQWAISLSTARNKDLSSYANYDPQTSTMDILVKGPAGQSSRLVTTTGNDQPVATITLGQDYDLSKQQDVLEEPETDNVEASTESSFDLSPIGQVTEITEELTIINPSDEGETVNTQQPEFKGTAPAGTVLTITVNSTHEITDSTTVNPDNTWNWSPPQGLEPGTHEITVQFTDDEGILQTISRSFIVFAAGESEDPAFSATPSATPIPTPSPTPELSPEARVSQPSTESGVPQPGSTIPTFIIFSLGLIMTISGLLYRKQISL